MTQLTKLFEPGTIGKLEIRNRLVMAAMGTHSLEWDGQINQRTIDYFVERAKGGVGLVITHSSGVKEARIPHSMNLYDDSFIPGVRKLARAVQAQGARMACQVAHPGVLLFGGWAGFERPPEIEIVGPSAVPCFTYKTLPRELSVDEIHHLIEAHAEAARRVKEVGFDAVELHAAHGYMASAFMSPFRNRRTDEYGGSVENRARFVCEMIARSREKVGPDYPVMIRMNGSDYLEGGLTVEEAKQQAVMFVEAGADAIDVSVATQDSRQWRDLTYMHPDGAIVHLAAAIKKVVRVPVITVGKIGDPILADRILREGKADFIAMARALFADPYLANKAREGRFEDIRRCIYCNNCRTTLSAERIKTHGTGRACTVNPALLREREFEIKPTATPKKVMVIGGGLAGMEAARTLAERGHQVSLYEKGAELGGQWNIASQLPHKSLFARLTGQLVQGLDRAGVKVTLNKEVTKTFVERQKPDAVVVATGSYSWAVPVPGSTGKNVVQAVDVISGKVKAGDRVVVVGGRLRGMEVAELLADQGKTVSIVTKNRLGEDGAPLEHNIFVTLRERLVEQRVMIFPLSPVFEIRENGVYVVWDGELIFLPADTVVMAVGAKSEDKLAAEIQGIVPEVYSIGDCAQPRDARVAMEEGAEIGRKI